MTDAYASERLNLHGRRHGRPLRKQRAALMETLLPALRVPLPPAGATLDPASLFAHHPRAVWLEVGFGGGEHLAAQAAAHPDVGFIGCEFFVNGVASLLKHVEAQGLANVRVHADDARPLLDALPDASLDRVFVLFADPWPKKRHAERRFIGPANLPRLARCLKPGGELRAASDDPTLIEWTREQLASFPAFAVVEEGVGDWPGRPADWPPTRYEQKAVAAGRVPVFWRCRRV